MLEILFGWVRNGMKEALLGGVADAITELRDGLGPPDGAANLRELVLALTAKKDEAVGESGKAKRK